MRTKRRQVNYGFGESVQTFIDVASEVIEGTAAVNSVNYDLTQIDTKTAVELLQITVDSSHVVKKNWISLRQAYDEVIFNLDWYIQRTNMDLKRYREKLHGETQIIPRDEFDIPDWDEESEETQ